MMASTLASILGFIFWLIVARFYPPSQVGLAGALFAAMSLLSCISLLGIHYSLVRFIPEEKNKAKLMNSGLTLVGICSLLAAVIFLIGLPLWSPDLLFVSSQSSFLIIFILFTIASALLMLQRHVFIAYRRAEFNLYIQAIWLVLRIVLVVAIVGLGVLGIFSSWGIGVCVALAVGFFFMAKVQPGYRPLPSLSKELLTNIRDFSVVNYLAEIINNVPVYILPLMVLAVLGAEQNSYYYIAATTAGVIFLIPQAVNLSLFAEGSHRPVGIGLNIAKSLKLLAVLLLPVITVLFIFGDKVLLIFGEEYSRQAFELFRLLLLATIPAVFNEIYLVVKMVKLHLKPIIYINALRAVLLLGLTYLLMKNLGLLGVGIGYLSAQCAVTAMLGLLALKRRLSKNNTTGDLR